MSVFIGILSLVAFISMIICLTKVGEIRDLKESYPKNCKYFVVYHRYSWLDQGWEVEYFNEEPSDSYVNERAKTMSTNHFCKVSVKMVKTVD